MPTSAPAIRPSLAGGFGALTFIAHQPFDVFNHHNGVVHQQADKATSPNIVSVLDGAAERDRMPKVPSSTTGACGTGSAWRAGSA
jgi:hypothetical protein